MEKELKIGDVTVKIKAPKIEEEEHLILAEVSYFGAATITIRTPKDFLIIRITSEA